MSKPAVLWFLRLLAGTAIVAAVVLTHLYSPLRALVVVPFLLVFPGLAWVRLLRLADKITMLMLAIALSVVIDTVVSGALVYAGARSPNTALAIVIALTLCGGVVEVIIRGLRHDEGLPA